MGQNKMTEEKKKKLTDEKIVNYIVYLVWKEI